MRLPLSIAAATALLSATQVSAEYSAQTPYDSDTIQNVAVSYASSIPADSDFSRGRAALMAGDYQRAVRWLDPLADGSMSPAVKLLAGYANLGMGRAHKAELHFGASLRLDRSDPFARHGLGLAALLQGKRDAAIEQLERLEGARQRCAGTCRQAERINIAAQSLRRAIS